MHVTGVAQGPLPLQMPMSEEDRVTLCSHPLVPPAILINLQTLYQPCRSVHDKKNIQDYPSRSLGSGQGCFSATP